jgi:alpha-1,2-mannosyltransferase
MLSDVQDQRESVNNNRDVTRSKLKTKVKLVYYRLLALLYALSGRLVDVCMVNSTWTANHISSIFGKNPITVFPPCDCTEFSSFALEGREPGLILSVGQFRPEKNYWMQLDIIEKLRVRRNDVKLVIVGGVRNDADRQLFDSLQKLVNEKSLPVELRANLPYGELKKLYRSGLVGLHTMRNEHFGICVVEYMSAGLIPMAHKSGGPLADIVRDEKYLADNVDEFVEKVSSALDEEGTETRVRFREESRRFGMEVFQQSFVGAIGPVISRRKVSAV